MAADTATDTPRVLANRLVKSRDSEHDAFEVYKASKQGEEYMERLREALRAKGKSRTAVANLFSLGTHIVPIILREGFKAKVNTVQHSIRVVFEDDGCSVRDNPEAREVYQRLKDGTITQPEVREIATRRHRFGGGELGKLSSLKAERTKLLKRLKEVRSEIAAIRANRG